MFLFILLFPLGRLSRGWKYNTQNGPPTYVRVTSVCDHCGTPIPERSAFCPSCGKSIREDTSDRYEPMY
ncbi:MAG: zinc-ribbon domain-containing protein [Candidatus Thorarchaeota archaeon]